jgi:hypothetical protein
MKKLIILILLATAANTFAQDWPVKKAVNDKKLRRVAFVQVPAFSFVSKKQLRNKGVYQELKLDPAFTQQLLGKRPEAIQLTVPVSSNETITCELVKFDMGNIKFTENDKDIIPDVKIPVTYRGVVSGEQGRNNVTLSVNENYLALKIAFIDKAIEIIKVEGGNKSAYRLYNSKEVKYPTIKLDCGTTDKPVAEAEKRWQEPMTEARQNVVTDKCVNVFVDCFDSLYQWQGSNKQQTIDYVYELFTAVTTGYFNEQINVQLTTVNVWTTADPFRGDTRENALADLANNYKDNFWGNICVGLDYSLNAPVKRSGIAGAIGRAKAQLTNTCPAFEASNNPFCYNDLNYTSIATGVTGFPNGPNTTGAAIYLVMHEMGHLLGSRHTHWCGWKLTSNPDTFGALDSCNATEGGCPLGAPPPLTGGTIMSYCVGNWTPNDFVAFNNGFGPQPGNVIRNFVDQNTCIPSCMACLIYNEPEEKPNPIRNEAPTKERAPKDERPMYDVGVNIPARSPAVKAVSSR